MVTNFRGNYERGRRFLQEKCLIRERQIEGDIKHKMWEACRRYNAMDGPRSGTDCGSARIIGKMGRTCYFQGPVQFNYRTHTYIGENFFANFNLMVMDDARIFIGDVCFGPDVVADVLNHPLIAKRELDWIGTAQRG